MKAVAILALVANGLAFSMPGMNMPNMPSMPGMGGSTSGSGSSSLGNIGSEMQSAMTCVMNNCNSQASACQADSKCNPISSCIKNCGNEYQPGTSDYMGCEADCASDLEDNENFQALMNCQGNCFIQAGIPGFDCLKDECSSQWQACQQSTTCSADLACANTCFGYEPCLKNCANDTSDSTLSSLLNCQIQCISNEF